MSWTSGVSKAERCSQHCAFGSRGAWPSGKQCTLLTCDEMCGVFLPGKGSEYSADCHMIVVSFTICQAKGCWFCRVQTTSRMIAQTTHGPIFKNKHIGHSFATAGGAQWVDPSECSWLWQVYPQQAQLLLMPLSRTSPGSRIQEIQATKWNYFLAS